MTRHIGLFALALVAATPSVARAQTVESRIDTVVARQMRARRIPGLSLAVIRDGHVVYAKGYGEANLEWHSPATPTTVYLLASMTKQFTATAIMMLVGEGKVRLTDSIAKYVSNAPDAWRGITVRHLLEHTSGLADRFELTADDRMFLDYSTSQMLDAARRTPVDFAPGASWQYSDQGYFLLGIVVERASGTSYGQFMRDRIFTPLGMKSTSMHDWYAIVPERADGYSLVGGQLIGSRRRYQFNIVSHYGVQSTVLDLARYDSALVAGALVPQSVLAQMWTPAKLSNGRVAGIAGMAYGFGWFLERFAGHPIVHHGGSTGTCVFRLPDEKLSVMVLTNLEQAAGSDPCFIARGVATRYVPSMSIVDAPVAANQDTARTARMRRAIDAFIRGKLDSTDYTPEAYAALSAAAVQQSAAFQQLGAMSSFELVAADTLAGTVAHYRARFANATIHFRFVLDERDRITSLQAR
ncbi:MAG TPA: serine hydrolase domain-containing protein [Gemmatimonadaceae bacterium]|nr:serine hydrolase domain-containing protein [Gemmatimonadaceae bacterium]